MPTAWVLMTAMPPTIGHANLIRFAESLRADKVNVLVCTQPDEPFAKERYDAVRLFAQNNLNRVSVHHLHDTLPQDPESSGFWEMWDYILKHPQSQWGTYGVQDGDYFVSSEPYGKILAERLNGHFFIYDRDRDLHYTKATEVREDGLANFSQILPEFRHNMQITATIFGAESTGKTTLAKSLAHRLNSQYVFEWARPYMETVGPEITDYSMRRIFQGQEALQAHIYDIAETPFIIQDTDLFSTIGYWEMPHITERLGSLPYAWERAAIDLASDLYIITPSNIPFEADPLRAGGNKREIGDEHWINVCERYGLNYIVLNGKDKGKRCDVAANALTKMFLDKNYDLRQYDRGGF